MPENLNKNKEKPAPAGERTVILQDEALRKLKGFVQIPRFVLLHSGLSFGSKVAYGVLLGYAWQDDFCRPAQETMARDLSCTDRQVRRLLTELKDQKLISWKQQGLNKPNIYYILPIPHDLAAKTKDWTKMSVPERTNPSIQERTNTSDKLETKEIYIKPLTVRNGDKKTSKKSELQTLPKLDQPIEQTQYLAGEILQQLGDRHSSRFYHLVASRIPESIIRRALSEIKADGANEPAKVFTYRMKQYAEEHLQGRSFASSF